MHHGTLGVRRALLVRHAFRRMHVITLTALCNFKPMAHPRVPGIAIGVLMCSMLTAQEHPYLQEYLLTELDGAIRVEWTIQGGSTCNGQDIERSVDGTNFNTVHRIEGLCGDPTYALPFQWVDREPPELTTVYYRIKLGFDGYSSIKPIFYGQLTETDQRFYPSPTFGDATLLLNVSATVPVELRIWDSHGRLVLARNGLYGPSIPLALHALPQGAYSYRADAQGRLFNGRFVKE